MKMFVPFTLENLGRVTHIGQRFNGDVIFAFEENGRLHYIDQNSPGGSPDEWSGQLGNSGYIFATKVLYLLNGQRFEEAVERSTGVLVHWIYRQDYLAAHPELRQKVGQL